jgi:hypothetical protein
MRYPFNFSRCRAHPFTLLPEIVSTYDSNNIATHQLPGHRAPRQLHPRPRPKLFHSGLVLFRRRSRRATHDDQRPGLQVPRRFAHRAQQTREFTHAHHCGHRRTRTGRRAGTCSCVRLACCRYEVARLESNPTLMLPWQGHSVTKIGLPEAKLGIIPGAGGTQRVTRLLGLSKAKDLIYTGRSLTAVQAEELGTCQRQTFES